MRHLTTHAALAALAVALAVELPAQIITRTTSTTGTTTNTIQVLPPGPAPTGVTAQATGPTTVVVNWVAATGSTGYTVGRGTSSSGPFMTVTPALVSV